MEKSHLFVTGNLNNLSDLILENRTRSTEKVLSFTSLKRNKEEKVIAKVLCRHGQFAR